ncbi:MAG: efflux RND transporter periplasmic adaptor subunit, partial [Cyanobacteria bacterium J06553_1]
VVIIMTTQRMPEIWKNPKMLGALAALLLLGVGGVAWLNTRAQQKQAELEEAAKPLPKQVKVAALGRVEPAGGIINVAASESGVVSELLVAAGDSVAQGQTLAYLDLYAVRTAERDYAQSQLIEAEQKLDAQLAFKEAQVQEATTRVAQVDLPQEESLRAQEAQIRDLQAQLNLAKIDLGRFTALAAQGAIAQQQLDSKTAEVAQISQKIASARATLAQLSAARNANLDNASAQVSAAQAELLVTQATAGVQSAQSNLVLAEARLTQTVVRSPINGQVIEVFIDPGESTGGQGGAEPILSVGETQTMQVVAEVYETDIGLVDVGQTATIRSRNGAFDENLTGTVSQVALQIFKNDVLDDDPAANADARVVEVDITVDQPEVIRSLTNLQVDVVIDLEKSETEGS